MTIKTIETAGFASALKALRLPYNKGEKSLIEQMIEPFGFGGNEYTDVQCNIELSPADIELLQTLIQRGDSHAKPMRGVLAYAEIEAPIDFFVELETYRMGHERLFSASTMNTEGKKLRGKALRRELDSVSFGRPIRKIDFFSYQCLRNIVIQRHNHRKMEWHEFIEWILTLPLSYELIVFGLEEEIEIHQELYEQYLNED